MIKNLMIQDNNLIKHNRYKIRRFPILTYNPFSNQQFEIKLLEKVLTSGTKNIFDTSVLKSLNVEELKYYNASYADFILVHELALTNETNNPCSGGYENNDNKRELITKMNKINSNGIDISSVPDGSDIDALLVETANKNNYTVVTGDVGMITNAHQTNTRFGFLLSKEFIDIYFKKGWKSLMDKVMKEISNHKKSNHIE